MPLELRDTCVSLLQAGQFVGWLTLVLLHSACSSTVCSFLSALLWGCMGCNPVFVMQSVFHLHRAFAGTVAPLGAMLVFPLELCLFRVLTRTAH